MSNYAIMLSQGKAIGGTYHVATLHPIKNHTASNCGNNNHTKPVLDCPIFVSGQHWNRIGALSEVVDKINTIRDDEHP